MIMIHRKISYVMALGLLTAAAWALPASAASRAGKITPLSDSMRQTRKTPTSAQREAFRKFAARQGANWQIRYSPRTALPEALTGGRTARYPGTAEQAAAAFFADNKELLNVDPSALRLVLKKEFMGVTHLQYQQYKDGLPVEFAYARVHVSASGEISGYQAKFEPGLSLNTSPSVPEQAAVAAAIADHGSRLKISKTELIVYPDETDATVKLAWKIRGRGNGLWVYYVDASSGTVLFKYDDLRYACAGTTWKTWGTSAGTIYPVSPIPDYSDTNISINEEDWAAPVQTPLRDQYVWVQDYSSRTVTSPSGDYCTQRPGKRFSSLKGPYFSVTNFRGPSAHYDNGAGQWFTYTYPSVIQSPHPYADMQDTPYDASIPDVWSSLHYSFAKAMPRFSSFQVGAMDTNGSISDGDEVYVDQVVKVTGQPDVTTAEGAYIGNRLYPFYGASSESPSFSLELKTDEIGAYTGFSVDISSYLALTDSTGTPNNITGSVLWSTFTTGVYLGKSVGGGDVNALSEVNAFYHLNAIHRFFDPINMTGSGAIPADLSKHVTVMVHAHGNADMLGGQCTLNDSDCDGMQNAFYDLERDNIMLGDGPLDQENPGRYRSFALDGTIIRHEYTHLVVNRIYPIINFGEFGALSEAIADYFSMSSFWSEPSPQNSVTTLGSFIGAGEAGSRNITGGAPTGIRKLSATSNCGSGYTCWAGEVHDDSLFLSQALYDLRKGAYDLGTFTDSNSTYFGQHHTDVFAFAALFYFPDNFANYLDAMLDACRQLEGTNCDAAMQQKIRNAFSAHGIGGTGTTVDQYEISTSSAMCRNNNGPECATEIGSLSSLSATINPMGDVDYYTLPLSAGNFTARLDLPVSQTDTYKAYALFLFDSNRNMVLFDDGMEAIATPHIDYPSSSEVCPDSGDCLTLSPSVTLNYTVPHGARYYLVVSAAPNKYYGNSEVYSSVPYTLNLSRTPVGSAQGSISVSRYDNDDISFEVPYSKFDMNVAPSSAAVLDASLTGTSEMSAAEFVFGYAQLRDNNYVKLADTLTNNSTSYLHLVSGSLDTHKDYLNRDAIKGDVLLQPGFAARYPGIGTVYLEIFGRNHLGHIVSMGVSNAINLSTNRSAVTAYNNIITSGGGSAIIKYEVQAAGHLTIKVYTQSGALVKTVYDGYVTAGKGTADWEGTNSAGGSAASGIYFVKTNGPGLDKIVKVAVVR